MASIEQVLKAATEQLRQSGNDSPSLDAAVLLCHILNKPRSYLLTWPEAELSPQQSQNFDELLARRLNGEPVAYITGEREFWSLNLDVSPATLIPRPDTERLVEVALDKAMLCSGAILDLGTGTGAIALALAVELPQRQVMAVDLQPQAVELAQHNAHKHHIHNVDFLQGSWFDPIKDGTKFALIVSNPPYIDSSDPHLSMGDVRFEPESALVAQENGLADIRLISEQAKHYLQPGGWLMFEHGFEQGQAVRNILNDYGYQKVETVKDYAGLDRVTVASFNQ